MGNDDGKSGLRFYKLLKLKIKILFKKMSLYKKLKLPSKKSDEYILNFFSKRY